MLKKTTENIEETKKLLEKVTQTPYKDNGLTDQDKVKKISRLFGEIMETLGLDLEDDSLMDTPNRVAKMYVHEFFQGLKPENFPKITTIENKMKVNQMVTIKDVKVMSNCEHHFVTIAGRAHIAYLPKDKVIGLSKINRVVDYFCRRPQVQERLTKQIADCLEEVLETKNVAVYLDAKHYCVISRGVQDINSSTITTDLRGVFLEDGNQARQEFLRLCGM